MIVFIVIWVIPQVSFSQIRSQTNVEQRIIVPDSILNSPILELPPLDSLAILGMDTIPRNDTTKTIPKGDIQTTINYYGEDSIITDFISKKVFLHKAAWFEYGNIRLDADLIIIDWEKSELFASGVTDSLGNITGNPIFKEGVSTYEIRKEMRYNFKTQKAIIKDVVTEQQDGLLRGETIKKDQDGSIFLDHGYYTTCNLAEPHWHINANKIKSIRGKQVVTGPFNFYFNDIPLPVGLPFGIIPDTPDEKASGIVFPSYGQEQVRGFFLRNFGYYFAFNDYVHTRVTGDIFSNGGYGAKASTIYKKRYRYNGGFNVDYQRFKSPETELNPVDYNTIWVNWQHTPETRGNSRFSASVNAGTTNYNNVVVNPNSFVNNVKSEFSSNVAYSKTFTGTPFSMSANLRHSQNIQSDEVNLILPDIAVNMNRQNPFQNVKFEPLKTLNIAWNFNLQNSINNRVSNPFGVQNEVLQQEQGISPDQNIIPFNLANLPLLLAEADNGAKNAIPITSNFTLFKYFTGTASLNYTELWYTERINYFYNPRENRVDKINENGFNRVYFYNTSFNMNTNVYGFYNFKKNKKIEAIRHHMQPSFGFNYNPDFSTSAFGFYQEVQVDESGRTQRFSRHQGFIFGQAPLGESRSLSINIRNTVEAKIKQQSDSEEETTKKIPLLQSLNLSTFYNFAADSFNLSQINFNTRTSFFEDKLSINLSGNLDPYAELITINPETGVRSGRRINKFAWQSGQGLGTFRSIQMNVNGSINPRGGKSPGEMREDMTNDFLQQGGQLNEFVEEEITRIVNDPTQYIEWDVPWNLGFGFNIAYNRQPGRDSNITSAINFNGDVSLSEKWKINFNAGYDFMTQQLTQSMIGIARDLHCWQMNVSWIPFGRFTSYNLDIRVKSSILQDLKVSRRRSFFDF
ncbi:LPS assembly outer membrane protein LptD (organic solvent tolerance protein OstA) [Aquiflexum balticum DSM 16537]|uniref:LPS assembly outer membrane protein LptD (Organic solvent tolerance protein OstA) n=1 Tax=Aquiflexum balticum DSM 16537 TaxID=758820 RepID=A0A1W2H5Q6_9BACT|nr:LPS assembly outer membrane protein LptD (organic solvent tolerance protein OstA) [Aquiflexum balticum DSM 16537]